MVDLTKKETMIEEESNSSNGNNKSCVDCKTTQTPLWRGGPAGPKSLCNACGIRYRKRRRAALALNKASEKKMKKKPRTGPGGSSANSAEETVIGGGNGGTDLRDSLKIKLVALSKDLYLQRLSSTVVKKQRWQRRRKLCEEELAAVSLLALSCDVAPVFA